MILCPQGMMAETVVHAPVPLGVNSSVESMDTLASTQKPPAWTTTTSPLRWRSTVWLHGFLTAFATSITITNSVVRVTVGNYYQVVGTLG